MRKRIFTDEFRYVEIVGNNHLIPLEYKFIECHDSNDDDESEEAEQMFYYKGDYHSLDDFMRIGAESELSEFDGIEHDTVWSGTIIKLCEDDNREMCVKAYKFYSKSL